ncbi:hypothetical protein HH212_08740 [Massilia forsythiae]|uniref:PEGA domain-containing protein n=1 Tax=Massilia forsythiae TaxID=2728020 RepID=A0A7Z2VVR0_9BURK|nr:hypothetical protein [Massilia forsythiae]QJE00104.1 hypothetical protein HH212_08740 [Massilia forsythiae]
MRHLLHALERQHALHLPHRIITPDSIAFDEGGTPRLLSSFTGDPAADIADDLTALARFVHYAITREVVPARPLRGRGLAGYSDSIMTAIDRSLAADPDRRPHSIGDLRDLLGIVVCPRMPAAGASGPGVQAYPLEALAPRVLRAPLPARKRRRVQACIGGLAMLLLVGMAWFAVLRRSPTFDQPMTASTQRPDAMRAALPHNEAPRTEAPHAAALSEPAPSTAPDAAAPLRIERTDAGNTGAGKRGRQADTDGAGLAASGRAAHGHRAQAPESRHRAATAAAAPSTPAATAAATAPTPSATVATTAAPATTATTATAATAAMAAASAASPPAVLAAPVVAAFSSPTASSGTPAPAPVSAAPEESASRPASTPSDAAREGATRAVRPAAARSSAAASGAVFDLQIRPWGVVHVDGVRRGVSPPIKQLNLAPGRHAILVTNPGSRDRMLDIDTARDNGRIAVDFDGVPQ